MDTITHPVTKKPIRRNGSSHKKLLKGHVLNDKDEVDEAMLKKYTEEINATKQKRSTDAKEFKSLPDQKKAERLIDNMSTEDILITVKYALFLLNDDKHKPAVENYKSTCEILNINNRLTSLEI